MKLELFDSAASLQELEREWSDLAERCASSPFQRPEWLVPWCRHLGPERIHAVALRESRRLVGLAPWFLYRSEEGVHVAFLGAGISDYLDVLVDPEHREESLARLFDHLHAERQSWDVCDLDELPPGSPLRHHPAPEGWSDSVEAQSVCPALEIPSERPEGASLAAAVPSGQMKKLRYYRRRMEREGPVEIRAGSPGEEPELMEGLFRLHEARWAEKGEDGVLGTGRLRSFHSDVARGLAGNGSLLLHGLWFRGRLCACYYAILDGRVLYCYLGGFAPEIATYSPGAVLLKSVFEEAVARGARRLDLLRGSEPYKYQWGATDRVNVRRRLWWRSRGTIVA